MRVRTRSAQPARLPALAGVVALALGVSVLPAAAADPDYRGWFLALDLALTQPNSLDQQYATQIQPGIPATVTRLTQDNGSDLTYRASAGCSFGRGLGNLKVSYWSLDNEDSESGNLAGDVFPAIFGYSGYSYSMYYYGYQPGLALSSPSGVPFEARSQVQADTLDIDYVRPIPVGDKFTLTWLVGLRVANYEEEQTFAGAGYDYFINPYTPPFVTIDETRHLESDGFGPRVGLTGRLGFTRHFSLEGSMVLSFLQADTDGVTGKTVDGILLAVNRGQDDNVRGSIRDFDLSAVWGGYGGGHLDFFLGYSVSEWDGLVADPVTPAGGAFYGFDVASRRGRDTISFNSLHGGVVFRFGRARASPQLPAP